MAFVILSSSISMKWCLFNYGRNAEINARIDITIHKWEATIHRVFDSKNQRTANEYLDMHIDALYAIVYFPHRKYQLVNATVSISHTLMCVFMFIYIRILSSTVCAILIHSGFNSSETQQCFNLKTAKRWKVWCRMDTTLNESVNNKCIWSFSL